MKIYLFIIALFFIKIDSFAQQDSTIKRLASVVTKNAKSYNGFYELIDSSNYNYDNIYIGGGVEQQFDLAHLNFIKVSSIDYYFYIDQIGVKNTFRYKIKKDSLLNSFNLIQETKPNILSPIFKNFLFNNYRFNHNHQLIYSEDSVFNCATLLLEEFNSHYYEYNINGFVKLDSIFYYNRTTEKVEFQKCYKYSYNQSNNIDTIYISVPLHYNIDKTINFYNHQNKLSKSVVYKKNANDSSYKIYYQDQYIFDELESSYTTLRWFYSTNDTSLNKYKYAKIISDDNLQIDSIIYDWVSTSDTWNENTKYTMKYDEFANLISDEYYLFSPIDKIWTKKSKTEYTYDVLNKLIEKTVYQKVSNENSWIGNSKNIYTYNANNNLQKDNYSVYKKICNCFEETTNKFYNWKTYFKPSTYLDETTFNSSIYPNPFSTKTTLVYESELDTKTFLSLTNIKGEMIDIRTFKSTKGLNNFEYENANLPLGNYFLKLNLKDKQKVFKVIKN